MEVLMAYTAAFLLLSGNFHHDNPVRWFIAEAMSLIFGIVWALIAVALTIRAFAD